MPTKPISRRATIFCGGAAILVGALSSCINQHSAISNIVDSGVSKKTYVLVHGAWHGGWCWDLVRLELERNGHTIFTPTLSGLGNRASEMNPTIGLDTHIDDVLAVIEENDLNDFILVGHSYGGMVITGVADRVKKRINHIVYLDAALPKNNQSMISYGIPKSKSELVALERQLRKLAPNGISMASFPPEFLGVPQDHPRYEWVKSRLTPHPLKTWLDPICLANAGEANLKRTYIHCTNPVLPQTSFPYIADQVKNSLEWQYHELETGHDAMITAPRNLTKLLVNA